MHETALIDVRVLPWRPRVRVMKADSFRDKIDPLSGMDDISGVLIGLALWLLTIIAAPLIVLVLEDRGAESGVDVLAVDQDVRDASVPAHVVQPTVIQSATDRRTGRARTVHDRLRLLGWRAKGRELSAARPPAGPGRVVRDCPSRRGAGCRARRSAEGRPACLG